MSYHDRIRLIATEMADKKIARKITIVPLKRKPVIDQHVPVAIIAVAKMAEAYEEGYMSNFPDTGPANEKMWRDNCKEEMIYYGLIQKSENPTRKEYSHQVGFEPTTFRLVGGYSNPVELL